MPLIGGFAPCDRTISAASGDLRAPARRMQGNTRADAKVVLVRMPGDISHLFDTGRLPHYALSILTLTFDWEAQQAHRPASPGGLGVLTRLAAASLWSVAGFILFTSSASAQDDGGGGGGAAFALIFWLAIGGGVAYFMYRNRQPFEKQVTSRLSPEDAIRATVQAFTMNGWTVTSHTGSNATFMAQSKGSCFIALLLLLIGLIPGLLYLAFRGRTMSANVHAVPSGSGTTVRINGNTRGFGGEAAANRAVASLA